MDYIWKTEKPANITEIRQFVSPSEKLAYTTISTIVSRLSGKGLLRRSKLGGGFVYTARKSKDQFLRDRSRGLIRTIIGNFGDLAIAGFVEEIKTDPQSLKRLRELADE